MNIKMGKLETRARNQNSCPVCANEDNKTPGAVVCWDCFKGGVEPLKYSDKTTEEWLNKYGKHWVCGEVSGLTPQIRVD